MTSTLTPEEQAKHVTIWNRIERRKIAGNAAPLRRNLAAYLESHPEWEEYRGQDKDPNLRPGAIDPITGERIAVQNEHVPIWHRADRRKVTGNAAPLRKNLEGYLRKYPDCEVYNGQDKVHRFAQSSASTAPRTVSASRAHTQASSSQLAVPTQSSTLSHPLDHHTHQPVRRWIYAPNRNSGWGMASAQQGQPSTQIQIQPANNHHTHTNTELSYMEMASSWSNNPEWVNQGAPHTPLTPGTMSGLHGLPQSFSSNFGPMSPMDLGDTNISGIPIPGGVSRDRPDLSMGASYGAGTTPDANAILGETPRSMEGDPDAMQFSPSYYLLGSFQGRSPPPIRISQSFFKPAVAPGTQN